MLTREKFGCANYLGNELSQATRIPVNRNILRSKLADSVRCTTTTT